MHNPGFPKNISIPVHNMLWACSSLSLCFLSPPHLMVPFTPSEVFPYTFMSHIHKWFYAPLQNLGPRTKRKHHPQWLGPHTSIIKTTRDPVIDSQSSKTIFSTECPLFSNQSEPVSERQLSYMFPHSWFLDFLYRPVKSCMYVWHENRLGTLEGTKELRRGRVVGVGGTCPTYNIYLYGNFKI